MTSTHNLLSGTTEAQAIRRNALQNGGVDPMNLRFRVVEYSLADGSQLSIPVEDMGFVEAVSTTQVLMAKSVDSHFCLEPIGYIQ